MNLFKTFKCEPIKTISAFSILRQDHPVRLVDQIIDSLDISGIIEGYKGGGTSSFSPRMMLKVIIYGYINNIKSWGILSDRFVGNKTT